MEHFDAVVVGGGIAGASIAYQLSADRSVCLVEQEQQLAVHSTGRSAATVIETLASPPVRELTISSRAFLENPAEEFEGSPLTPMGLLYIGGEADRPLLEQMYEDFRLLVPDVELTSDLPAFLRPEIANLALYEPRAMAIDVHQLHQGFIRGFRRNGGVVRTRTGIVTAEYNDKIWSFGEISTPLVVNAAGAWADELARALGSAGVGLQPLRRSAFMLPASAELTQGAPMMCEVNDKFYLKPESGGFLGSPVDEVQMSAGDAKAGELEIAQALEWIGEYTTLDSRRIANPWGGFRTFATDRLPVVGYDPVVPGLFWFAGQGGYGVQTSPALSQLGARVLRGEAEEPAFAPYRFSQ